MVGTLWGHAGLRIRRRSTRSRAESSSSVGGIDWASQEHSSFRLSIDPVWMAERQVLDDAAENGCCGEVGVEGVFVCSRGSEIAEFDVGFSNPRGSFEEFARLISGLSLGLADKDPVGWKSFGESSGVSEAGVCLRKDDLSAGEKILQTSLERRHREVAIIRQGRGQLLPEFAQHLGRCSRRRRPAAIGERRRPGASGVDRCLGA